MYSAHQGVEHDDMNVLVLGGRVIGCELARDLVTTFPGAAFTREDRHRQRLQKVEAIAGRYSGKAQFEERTYSYWQSLGTDMKPFSSTWTA